MRIGELLVEQRQLRQSDLMRALAEQPAEKRLCSFLIAKGFVDFDDASRALGEQKRVACALTKHLAGRDPTLAKLIPPELGRSSCALPIGRSSKGVVIVCVRDPAPALLAALRQATKAEVTMVIAPAARLEHLIAEAYGSAPSEEFDVDFNSELGAAPKLPPKPDLDALDALDPDSVRLALTDLDDIRVDKDPTQSLQTSQGRSPTLPPATGSTPPSGQRVVTGSTPPSGQRLVRTGSTPESGQRAVSTGSTPEVGQRVVPRRPSSEPRVTRPMTVDMMEVGLAHAGTREAATDLVLAYVGTRWSTGLVLAIRDKVAIGYRGTGVSSPESVSIPLGAPSTVQRAVETRGVSVHVPSGTAQDALARALERPKAPAAAPVVVGGQPVAVIAVGDPIEGMPNVENATTDLGILAEALGAAYSRIVTR